MADRIQHRRDTRARWEEINPILLEGEISYILDDITHYKMGDGVHSWNDLPLRGHDVNIVQELGNDDNSVVSQKTITKHINDINEKLGDKPSNSVTGVKGNAETAYRTGNINITPEHIGLGNVDNTSDDNKSVLRSKSSEKASKDENGNIIHEFYATKTSVNECKDIANDSLAVADNANELSTEAFNKSVEASSAANTAKNAVATLEGLSNTTTAQETLAAQVVQIEENKQNLLLIPNFRLYKKTTYAL